MIGELIDTTEVKLTLPPGFNTLPEVYAEQARVGLDVLGVLYQQPPANVLSDTLFDAYLASAALQFPGAEFTSQDRELKELAHWQVRWGAHGFQTFQLTHGLAAALSLTDCSGVSAEEARWPYPSFLVTLPHPDGPIVFTDRVGTLVPARWIIVHTIQVPTPETWDRFVDLYTELCDPNQLRRTDSPEKQLQASRTFAARLVEARSKISWRPETLMRVVTENGLTIFRRDGLPAPGDKLERWIDGADQEFSGGGMLPINDPDRYALEASARLVANLGIYLNNKVREDAAFLRPAKPRAGRGLPGKRGITTWALGSEVKLPRQVRDSARAFCEQGKDASASWKLHSRFMVRGHYRQQAFGTGRAERKRIWIEPHWKGPETAEEMKRLYHVDEAPQGVR